MAILRAVAKRPGIKAKRSLLDNGSPELHFEVFPEDVDIASVSIPINKEYLALEDELYIGDEKMNIGAENTNINVQINSIKGRIETLSAALNSPTDSFETAKGFTQTIFLQ